MSEQPDVGSHRTRRWRRAAAALVLLILVAGAALFAVVRFRDRGVTPKLLNRPTAAREVRPLSEKSDSRFAPLPLEDEKHER